jgi:hypothetical protein
LEWAREKWEELIEVYWHGQKQMETSMFEKFLVHKYLSKWGTKKIEPEICTNLQGPSPLWATPFGAGTSQHIWRRKQTSLMSLCHSFYDVGLNVTDLEGWKEMTAWMHWTGRLTTSSTGTISSWTLTITRHIYKPFGICQPPPRLIVTRQWWWDETLPFLTCATRINVSDQPRVEEHDFNLFGVVWKTHISMWFSVLSAIICSLRILTRMRNMTGGKQKRRCVGQTRPSVENYL